MDQHDLKSYQAPPAPAPVVPDFAVVRNRRDGWSARNRLDLGEKNRQLEVSTYKGNRGVVTSFMVGVHEGGCVSYALFSDYSKTLKHAAYPRATSKSIRDAHTAALAQLPAIVAEVLAFYVAKDAKAAKDVADAAAEPSYSDAA